MSSAPLARPTVGTVVLNPDETEWQSTDTPGFWLRPLLDDGHGGTTSLMRLDPGASAGLHSHDQLEEIVVLSGEFHDEQNSYPAGHYCVRAIGESHTAASVSGCVVLLIYRP